MLPDATRRGAKGLRCVSHVVGRSVRCFRETRQPVVVFLASVKRLFRVLSTSLTAMEACLTAFQHKRTRGRSSPITRVLVERASAGILRQQQHEKRRQPGIHTFIAVLSSRKPSSLLLVLHVV